MASDSTAADRPLQRTPLHDLHVAAGARMVDFGGWHMPLQYEGILAEHRRVREAVGLFDVSHMGEIDFHGEDALAAIQRLVTNDASRLGERQALYTCACYADGGIVDDCIVYRFAADHYRIVVNASNIAKDFDHFRAHAGELCEIVNRSAETALIAVQGPQAAALVARLAGEELARVPSFGFAPGRLADVPIVAARTGYTGEDGFELFLAGSEAPTVWKALVDAGAAPIGLGARDTLRLEARLSLYGNDIDATTTPLEAGLGWVVKLDKPVPAVGPGPFIGHDALARQKREGLRRKLVGFKVIDRGIVRAHAEVLDGEAVVGEVTSGGPAPTVGGAVGLAYVPSAMAEPGSLLTIRQRGQVLKAEIVKGPFYRRPAAAS
ncbi:MAG: glycine cleavage system aminomethyltransferase GcvT [Nannocystaceae bacterium]